MDDPNLYTLRRQIDEIDQQLIESLAKRFQLSLEIAARKRTISSSVLQPDRAAIVENNYVRVGESFGLNNDFMRQLYHIIHNESCRVQTEILGDSSIRLDTLGGTSS